MTDPLATPREVAQLLACGVSTVYRLCAAGVLPVVKIPGTALVRFRRDRLEGLLKTWEEQGGRRRGRR